MIKLYLLILLSNTTNLDKIKSIYFLSKIEQPKITSAIIIYETGWLKCSKNKTTCSLDYNNLFGFRRKGDYLKFDSYSSSIKYYSNWQEKYWHRYKLKNPSKNYYDFLKWIGYCNSMKDYIRVIKQIEKYDFKKFTKLDR